MFHQIERGRFAKCCPLWEFDWRTEIRLVHSYIDWIAIAVDLIYLNRRGHILKRRWSDFLFFQFIGASSLRVSAFEKETLALTNRTLLWQTVSVFCFWVDDGRGLGYLTLREVQAHRFIVFLTRPPVSRILSVCIEDLLFVALYSIYFLLKPILLLEQCFFGFPLCLNNVLFCVDHVLEPALRELSPVLTFLALVLSIDKLSFLVLYLHPLHFQNLILMSPLVL